MTRKVTSHCPQTRSPLHETLRDEGQPRANESGPLTILQPLKQGRRCDVSMPNRSRSAHPTSTPSEQRRPTEPVHISVVMDELLAQLIERDFPENTETLLHKNTLGKD